MNISFFIPGHPKTAGSKRAFFNRHTGRAMVVDTCKNGDWKNACAWAAKSAWALQPEFGALSLAVTFYLPRPKAHFRTGKHAGELRPESPDFHSSKPDATKLIRCLEDALTGILWRDDAQIVRQAVEKRYGDRIGASVRVGTVGEVLREETKP